jgi:organic radical activating enzyme
MSKQLYDVFEKEPTNGTNWLIMDWQPLSLCNFSCSYCHPNNYNGKIPAHELDDCIHFLDYVWQNVAGDRQLFFNITGGEPTLWKHLDAFCQHVKSLGTTNVIRLITNGTRPIKWWLDRSHAIDMVIVSIHHGQSKKEAIAEKFNQLYAAGVDVSLHSMIDTHHFEECMATYEYLAANLDGPSLSFKPLRVDISQEFLQDYTPEQLSQMSHLQEIDAHKHHQQQPNMQWRGLDGTVKRVNNIQKDLLITRTNDWHDWYCNIGMETLVVNSAGIIRLGSSCFKNLGMGNIQNREYNLANLPIKCKYDYCGCLTDLQTTKTKTIPKGAQYIDAGISDSTYKIATRD